MVGWCHLRNDVRMFRLDRVLALESAEVTFSKPLDFDCVAFVLESLATIQWGWPIEVFLELSLADAQRRVAPDMSTLEQCAGGVLLGTHTDALDWAARLLVQLDCPFRVQHPPELRDAVFELARRVSRQARGAPRNAHVARKD
jgi:predicted DNA-binding transcriptional regulator YafY